MLIFFRTHNNLKLGENLKLVCMESKEGAKCTYHETQLRAAQQDPSGRGAYGSSAYLDPANQLTRILSVWVAPSGRANPAPVLSLLFL